MAEYYSTKFRKFLRNNLYIILSLVVVISGPILLYRTASAEGKCDTTFYSKNDILYYTACDTCTTGDTVLIGESNEEKIYKWLVGKSFNAAQAAGILGNMAIESPGFNPYRMQTTYQDQGIEAVLPIESHSEKNKAFGIIQWDSGRRQQVLKQVASKFPDYITLINTYGKSAEGYKQDTTGNNEKFLAFELEFMYQELTGGYSGVLKDIQAQPDTEEGMNKVAAIWNERYEVSADSSSNRAASAKTYYEKYKNSSATTGSSSNQCGSEPSKSISWYSQCDPRWKDTVYAGSTICAVGCGPSSMAIILASLVDKNITPADVAAVAGVQDGGTSNHANLIAGVKEKWKVTITDNLTMDEAVAFVKAGKGYVWMGGQGSPPFTTGGHLVAMVGVTSDGQVTIADPYGDGPGHQHITNYPVAQLAAESGARYGVSK
jgi:hypothetical protein